ncbi:dephospho-CoA kinase [Solwaraspora sp. WMMD1047]|uniref:dephospho-CoA kinase n=1 Tax=Solwaraspora sp. WMMD1047 TaxID=3016102 RepID=UPI0024174939|nr:dephospho-CoA kinase [Solwaraspora sp. WMMD1047]MDG4831968.1 dephospho-CoA kinase [Solwaraspora sp. WMMD1047]
MLSVGLTGGIGSGKSAVAARLAGHGAVVIDSDRLAREVVAAGTDGHRAVVAAFGERVLAADGELDRAALGGIVFADATARSRLEEIIHPRVRARSAELAAAAPPDAVLVNDVPLLVEVGLAPAYHLVVVVSAAAGVRVDRLVRHRAMTAEQAQQRIDAQVDDERRQAAADVLLDNNGPLTDLHAAVDALWTDRLVPYEHNVRQRRHAARPQPVSLVEPDPTWPAQYARLAARIRHALRPAEPRIDHIGSTAVPGLAAKDIIDIQLGVDTDAADPLAGPEAAELVDRLSGAGFPPLPGQWWDTPHGPGQPPDRWPKLLHGNADPGRPVNLHVRVAGSPGWRYALLMRDHLRADPARVAEYLAVKRGLAAQGLPIEAYAAAKEPWFDEEHRLAEEWAEATGWRP